MKRLIMATMVTAILASSTVWAADNAPVAAQQQTQQVQQTQKTAAAAERISEQGLYAMRDVQVARLALFHGDPEKAKELTNEASALLSDDSTEWAKFAKEGANKWGNSSRLTQSFHFFMFEPIFSPVNALN
ncbi:YfdX family protein, partial [Escherichia coli]